MSDDPPLRPLHPASSLSRSKLAVLERVPTWKLKESLLPGRPDSLKARPNGTMLDGHHRIHILKDRGEDVDALPREVIPRDHP